MNYAAYAVLLCVLYAAPAAAQVEGGLSSPAGSETIQTSAKLQFAWLRDLQVAAHFGAMGPPPSHLEARTGLREPRFPTVARWLELERDAPQVLTIGYAWREFTVEGSTSTRSATLARSDGEDRWRFPSRSARLSYRPLPGLSVQLSRGMLDGVDQVLARGDQRRTSLSATYSTYFTGGEWQTTLAWGRYSEARKEAMTGYLAETSVRFRGAHLAFGRVEQVARDELPGVQPIPGKVSKLTIGYYQDLHQRGPDRLGIGILASRYLASEADLPNQSDRPATYMAFMKLSLQ
jgi:hypothetical protein